jgi:hypothetical protein
MRIRLLSLMIPAAVALAASGGCSNESEGQPCDPLAADAGSSDCNAGLVCTSNLPNANGARCCPADRSTAKTPECALSSGVEDANPSPPEEASSSGGDATVDGGGGDSTTEGAAGEAGTEAAPTDSTTTDGTVEAAEQ